MGDCERVDKYEALVRYMRHYRSIDLPVLDFPLSDKQWLLEACEKQIPKNPYYRREEDAEGYACPVCDMGVTVDHGRIRDAFCSHCGQALDWGI